MNDSDKKASKSKKWTTLGLLLLLFLIAIQFIRKPIPNKPVTGDLLAPADVKSILQRSCYNCHSNETRLSWYDQVVPAYWLVKDHIVDGRQVLNFSEWNKLATGDQEAKMWESVNQIITGAMPLSAYTLVHRSAMVSANDIRVLKNYLISLPVLQTGDSQKIETLKEQILHEKNYRERKEIPVALNGVRYFPNYRNWQPVSSTERYDNGTLRVIVGNEIAIKAISDKNTNPWPEGTVFGKITWDELKDSADIIHTGPFKQVEFMIKDSKKYGKTRNWGFARFKTAAMVPYGKTAQFASECVNCHQPMKDFDFVFTIPFQSPFDSREFNLVGSYVNQKDSSMSILYGKKGNIKRVTWKQKPDEHWFGANAPGILKSVETVSYPIPNEFSVLP
jgi:hypothetical protein